MTKPNLLFIFTDEQRYDTMAAYGNDRIQTPNLDRLANEGIVFERAYVTQTVCTPSRSSIMTGLYPHSNECITNNIPLTDQFKTLVELADFNDYRKCYNGKWHLGDEIFCQHGFDEWVSTEDAYRQYYGPEKDRTTQSSYCQWLIKNGFEAHKGNDGFEGFGRGTAARMPEEFCKPTFQAQEASKFIHANKDNPFILYVNFLEPHMPFYGPRDDQYDPAEVTLPPDFEMRPTAEQPSKARELIESGRLFKSFMGSEQPDEKAWRQLIARYWGLVSQIDTAVGTILQALNDAQVEDDTIVVFTSDHGDMMGSHQLVTKCFQFEEAARVPLLLKIPGHKNNGKRIPEPVSQIDLVPTLLDLLGKDIPDSVQGYSWRKRLEEHGNFTEENVFIEWNAAGGTGSNHDVRTIITADLWKCNISVEEEHELYNLAEDPMETNNLFKLSEHKDKIIELYNLIINWQQRTGDNLVLPEIKI